MELRTFNFWIRQAEMTRLRTELLMMEAFRVASGQDSAGYKRCVDTINAQIQMIKQGMTRDDIVSDNWQTMALKGGA